MAETEIDTGSSSLDKGLKLLFESCEAERLQEVQRALSCADTPEQELASLLPDGALYTAHVLSSPAGFRELRDQVKKDARDLIDRAKGLVDEHLSSILGHPAVVGRLKSIVNAAEAKDASPLLDSLHKITTISQTRLWVGVPPELSPSVLIGFIDRKQRLLLQSTLNLDELLFLVRAISKVVEETLQDAQPLAQADQLDLGDIPKLARHIAAIDEHLAEIKRLAPTVGIDLDSNAEPEVEAGDRGA